jgi:hypothetical protein
MPSEVILYFYDWYFISSWNQVHMSYWKFENLFSICDPNVCDFPQTNLMTTTQNPLYLQHN